MMMPQERKKAVTVIIAGMGGEKTSNDLSDYDYARHACGRKIMQSLEEKNVEEFCEYLSEFITMCKEKPSNDREY